MSDDRLPITRIFTALFFIETDYVTTLLNPYFLDFERGRILCIAALWNTFKPSCTAAKHRSVNFLLPAHPHPDDIAHRWIALLKGFQGRFQFLPHPFSLSADPVEAVGQGHVIARCDAQVANLIANRAPNNRISGA